MWANMMSLQSVGSSSKVTCCLLTHILSRPRSVSSQSGPTVAGKQNVFFFTIYTDGRDFFGGVSWKFSVCFHSSSPCQPVAQTWVLSGYPLSLVIRTHEKESSDRNIDQHRFYCKANRLIWYITRSTTL